MIVSLATKLTTLRKPLLCDPLKQPHSAELKIYLEIILQNIFSGNPTYSAKDVLTLMCTATRQFALSKSVMPKTFLQGRSVAACLICMHARHLLHTIVSLVQARETN